MGRNWKGEERERDSVAFGIIMAVIVGMVIAIAAWLYFYQVPSMFCSARWPDHENQFDIMAGCQVMTSEGWVPEDRYRIIE